MKKYKQCCVGVGSMIESDDGTWVSLDEYNIVKDAWSKHDLRVYELECEQVYLQSDLTHYFDECAELYRTKNSLSRWLVGSIMLNGITAIAILTIIWNIL